MYSITRLISFPHHLRYFPLLLLLLLTYSLFSSQVLDLKSQDNYAAFNKPIDFLPSSLKSLTLGDKFNYPVDTLPKSLKYLSIGNAFNCPMNSLPDTIEELHIGHLFNHQIERLPSSLHILVLGHSFDQPIPYPPNLKQLTLGANFINSDYSPLPSSLTHLRMYR